MAIRLGPHDGDGNGLRARTWAHPSSLFRPHKVDHPEEVPGWEVGGLFPNGDSTIFVAATMPSVSSATWVRPSRPSTGLRRWPRSVILVT